VTWEPEARNWIAWAREPRHDAYWYFRDSFFDEILPPAGRATLDVGCGEGRVARDLAARGHRVTGVDAAPSLVAAAREADPDGTYVVSDAASLPFDDESFDLVVAYNSLMDIDDMAGAVREASRVLESGSPFCVCLTHPFFDAGRFESRDPNARFIVDGSYFGKRRFEGTVEQAGLSMTFRGWTYALDDYARAFEDAGFVFERVREPIAGEDEDPRHARMPLFLHLRARKFA
jgi:SAM-dependent methyltransferase